MEQPPRLYYLLSVGRPDLANQSQLGVFTNKLLRVEQKGLSTTDQQSSNHGVLFLRGAPAALYQGPSQHPDQILGVLFHEEELLPPETRQHQRWVVDGTDEILVEEQGNSKKWQLF